MDGLKQINDTFGHAEGSLALSRLADILRQTFRDSDIVGRIGGDEFAILATNVSVGETKAITSRLEANLAAYNALGKHPYALALSIGAVPISPDANTPIEEFITQADAAMYR